MNHDQSITNKQIIFPSALSEFGRSTADAHNLFEQPTVHFPRKIRRSVFVHLPAEPEFAHF